jgi:hypothetical protein
MRIVPRVLVVAAFAVAAAAASAQTNTTAEQPFVFPNTVSTSPVQVLPFNPGRQTVEFCNPNPIGSPINCAVCPQVSRKAPNPVITCALGAAGSISLPPSWCWGKTVTTPNKVKTAWNAVCSASSGFTALETE